MSPASGEALLGIDLGGTKISVALATPDGQILDRRTIATEASRGAEHVLRRTGSVVFELLRQRRCLILAVAAVTPGVPSEAAIALAPNIAGWEQIDLERRLRGMLGEVLPASAPVIVHNDVKAGALHEARAGALTGSRVGFYLNLGTGISSAIVIDDKVVLGAHGAAGEIAYQLVTPDDLVDASPHDRAPLERLAGGRALDAAASVGSATPVRASAAIGSSDPAVRDRVEHALRVLEQTVVNVCCLLDPDTVVLAGGLLNGENVLPRRLQQAIDAAAPCRAVVRLARNPFDAPLYGALLLARDAHRPAGAARPGTGTRTPADALHTPASPAAAGSPIGEIC